MPGELWNSRSLQLGKFTNPVDPPIPGLLFGARGSLVWIGGYHHMVRGVARPMAWGFGCIIALVGPVAPTGGWIPWVGGLNWCGGINWVRWIRWVRWVVETGGLAASGIGGSDGLVIAVGPVGWWVRWVGRPGGLAAPVSWWV